MKNYILLTAVFAILTSCHFNKPEDKKTDSASGLLQGKVKEVLQTSSYTYILAENDGNEIWIAGPKTEAKVGELFYYEENMRMQNFQSKELNRFFETVIFATKLSKNPEDFKVKTNSMSNTDIKAKIEKQNINIVIPSGATSIADLFKNKDKYKGTKISVKGVVTKYNAGIMNKNWIHLQDGTEHKGNFDLVVTSLINCQVGDTLTLQGKVLLDQDFGYGYKYDVLIEDGIKK